MARVVELEVIKGLPVSPFRPISVDKPPPPAPVDDAKPAVVVNRGLPGPGILPAPGAPTLLKGHSAAMMTYFCLRCGESARCGGVDIGPAPPGACGPSLGAGALREGSPFRRARRGFLGSSLVSRRCVPLRLGTDTSSYRLSQRFACLLAQAFGISSALPVSTGR